MVSECVLAKRPFNVLVSNCLHLHFDFQRINQSSPITEVQLRDRSLQVRRVNTRSSPVYWGSAEVFDEVKCGTGAILGDRRTSQN